MKSSYIGFAFVVSGLLATGCNGGMPVHTMPQVHNLSTICDDPSAYGSECSPIYTQAPIDVNNCSLSIALRDYQDLNASSTFGNGIALVQEQSECTNGFTYVDAQFDPFCGQAYLHIVSANGTCDLPIQGTLGSNDTNTGFDWQHSDCETELSNGAAITVQLVFASESQFIQDNSGHNTCVYGATAHYQNGNPIQSNTVDSTWVSQ